MSVSLLLYQVDKVARDTKMINVSGGTLKQGIIARQVYFVFGQWYNLDLCTIIMIIPSSCVNAELKCSKKTRYLLSDIYLPACTLYAFYNFDNNRTFSYGFGTVPRNCDGARRATVINISYKNIGRFIIVFINRYPKFIGIYIYIYIYLFFFFQS